MDYLVDIEEIARENDIGIGETEFDSVDGVCLGGNKGYLVIVDSRLSPYHRRWTIAHELAHIADDTVDSYHSRLKEYRADSMAMDTLVPDDLLEEARREYGDDCDFINCLFGVSVETMQKKVNIFTKKFIP